MSRQIGSPNRRFFYPSNLERHSSHVSISDLTSSSFPRLCSDSPRMDSDDSTQKIFDTIFHLNNADVETPDKFHDSEPSPSTCSQTPFLPLVYQLPNQSSPASSSYTDATPILSPITSDQPYAPIPVNVELEHELDKFITLQQQLQNPHILTSATPLS